MQCGATDPKATARTTVRSPHDRVRPFRDTTTSRARPRRGRPLRGEPGLRPWGFLIMASASTNEITIPMQSALVSRAPCETPQTAQRSPLHSASIPSGRAWPRTRGCRARPGRATTGASRKALPSAPHPDLGAESRSMPSDNGRAPPEAGGGRTLCPGRRRRDGPPPRKRIQTNGHPTRGFRRLDSVQP